MTETADPVSSGTASNGLSADMTVPTVVLTAVGAMAVAATTKVVTPELVL
jgi:hypothetical protein